MTRIVHTGITRSRQVVAKKTEPSPAQAAVLEKLRRPRTTRKLSALLGRSENGIRSSLVELRAKGFVKGPDGDNLWRRA